MSKVRWGLVSTANINRRLIPAIRASERGELVAVASRSQQAADAYAAVWGIPQAFDGYQAMLDSGQVDAVYISLPNHLHAEWSIRALQAGVNVLCEKPFALTLAEVDQMIAAANDTGKVLAEAFMYLHHPQTKLAGEWAHSGRLGDVTLVRGAFNYAIASRDDVRLVAEWGGGCLWDVGVYPLSFAQFIFGAAPEWVVGDQWLGDTGVDEGFHGELHYAGGGVAQIAASFRTPYLTVVEVIGTAGRLVIEDPFRIGVDGNPFQILFYPPDGEPQVVPVPQDGLYRFEVDDMNAAILDGAPAYVTLAETRNHIRTTLALYESARTGQLVRLTDSGQTEKGK